MTSTFGSNIALYKVVLEAAFLKWHFWSQLMHTTRSIVTMVIVLSGIYVHNTFWVKTRYNKSELYTVHFIFNLMLFCLPIVTSAENTIIIVVDCTKSSLVKG